MKAPKSPKLKNNPKPDRNLLRIEFPQHNSENDIAYRKRINVKYKKQK